MQIITPDTKERPQPVEAGGQRSDHQEQVLDGEGLRRDQDSRHLMGPLARSTAQESLHSPGCQPHRERRAVQVRSLL